MRGKVQGSIRKITLFGLGLMLFAGCSNNIDAPSEFYIFSPMWGVNQGDTFTCLGISDEQFKSVLAPGVYSYEKHQQIPLASACDLRNGHISISFAVWGAKEIDPYTSMIRVSYFEPYMFYRFPKQLGVGGALWGGAKGWLLNPRSSADPDATPIVALELYHNEANGFVDSRGVYLVLYGTSGVSWNSYPIFRVAVISAMTQLVFWAAQGLTREYPELFPNSLPDVNPSPYIPPLGGSLPTGTAIGDPTPPLTYPTLPPRYSPSASPSEAPAPTTTGTPT